MAAVFRALAKIKMVKLDSLVWSNKEFEVSDFLEQFRLPQIVQVHDGVYETTNEQTMANGQILKLHAVQKTEKIIAETLNGEEVRIPLSCPQQLEVLPGNVDMVECHSIEELFRLSPKYARALETISRPNISEGTVFELKSKTLLSNAWYLELKNVNKPHNRVQVPLSLKAKFAPLAEPENYFLVEAATRYPFPFRVKFVTDTKQMQENSAAAHTSDENIIDLPSLGILTLRERKHDSIVISTSRNGRNVTVVTFPTDLSIMLSPALGLLQGDSNYARICKDFHDGVDLEKIKKNNRHNPCFTNKAVQQTELSYEEIPPLIPPRDDLPQPEVKKISENENCSEAKRQEPGSAIDAKYSKSHRTPPLRPKKPNSKWVAFPQTNCKEREPAPLPFSSDTQTKSETGKESDTQKLGYNPLVKPKTSVKIGKANPLITVTDSVFTPRCSKKVLQKCDSESTEQSQEEPPTYINKQSRHINELEMRLHPVPKPRSDLSQNPKKLKATPSTKGAKPGCQNSNSVDISCDLISFIDDSKSDDPHHLGISYTAMASAMSSDERLDEILEEKRKSVYNDGEQTTNTEFKRSKTPVTRSRSLATITCSFLPRFFRRRRTRSLTTLDELRSLASGGSLHTLSVHQVVDCLKLLNLSKYKKAFKKKQIDGSLLVSLTDQQLIDLGVHDEIDRTKILKFVYQGWVPKK